MGNASKYGKSSVCIYCKKDLKFFESQSTGKYCSNQCQQDWQWENKTKPKILNNEVQRVQTLRRFLIEQRGYKCEWCGNNGFWRELPMSLEVDHIDGNRKNNFPNNIRLLCPNCHSQTDTFRSKNICALSSVG